MTIPNLISIGRLFAVPVMIWALIDGRDHVLPEDVQTVFPHIAGHRLHLANDGRPVPPALLARLVAGVAVDG